MLIDNGDGTHTAGPFDALCIFAADDGCFRAAFLEERPMPGPIESRPAAVRLISKMHHTGGADDMEGALEHLDKLSTQIIVPTGNVWRENAISWDGTHGAVFMLETAFVTDPEVRQATVPTR